MRIALNIAQRGLGLVWPNPAVGCVIVKDYRIVGRGWTGKGGRPHAEIIALSRASEMAIGATAFISLEPCFLYQKPDSCADAFIDAGIKRVVIAVKDPNPLVFGRGIERLQKANIDVEVGCEEKIAKEINAGFFKKIIDNRPLITLKIASSQDGKIATSSGESKWITESQSRLTGHRLRAQNDAILIGVKTALIDDPELTCRLPGLEDCSPVRLILDSNLHLPITSKLVMTAKLHPTWLITRNDNDEEYLSPYITNGVTIIGMPLSEDGKIDLIATFHELANRGLTRILVEGGSSLATSLMRLDLIDRIAWFQAPIFLGNDGVAAIKSLGIDDLEYAHKFRRISVSKSGNDLFTYLTK
jgi:diaminohydroxyphosphoribosylaminopyrimidine deaminase/5-amino-6-(5-phosphoribosylamino)uracil reductase